MLTLDQAIANARKQAGAAETTVYIHRHRGRGYIANLIKTRRGKPAAARVTKDGVVAYWSETIEHYVTVPE